MNWGEVGWGGEGEGGRSGEKAEIKREGGVGETERDKEREREREREWRSCANGRKFNN